VIGKLERGEVRLRQDHAERLSAVLGVSQIEFFTDIGEEELEALVLLRGVDMVMRRRLVQVLRILASPSEA
jgi:hypothetical protein